MAATMPPGPVAVAAHLWRERAEAETRRGTVSSAFMIDKRYRGFQLAEEQERTAVPML